MMTDGYAGREIGNLTGFFEWQVQRKRDSERSRHGISGTRDIGHFADLFQREVALQFGDEGPRRGRHLARHRVELAAAHHRERAAQEQVSGAKGSYLPRVNAFGSLDYDYGWKYQNGGGSYTAGALLQWDLWDGKLTRAKVREANANLESTREEERKLRLALDLEVERARLDLNAANERLSVTDQVVAQAAESASLTRARFEQELTLPTELIDAETALVNARVRRAEAEADRQIAIAAVRKALALPQLDSQAKAR